MNTAQGCISLLDSIQEYEMFIYYLYDILKFLYRF